MRTQTELRYLDRVDRAAQLLAESLEDPPTSDELARRVAVSRFHFQRIYRAVTGETVLDTLRRLRAVKALERLDAGDPVTEVAAAVGYDTSQAFARAFRQWTGLTPSQARGRGAELARRFRRPQPPGLAAIEVEIGAVEPMRLSVLRTRRPVDPLNDVYESLFEAIAAQDKLPAVSGIYALPENDPASEQDGMESHIAAVCLGNEAVEGFETLDIDGGPALRLRHVGPFETIEESARALYARAVARDLALADHPPVHHHLDEPEDVPPDKLRTDLYLLLADPQEGQTP